MTHTLHRFGHAEDLATDFIVTMMSSRGLNDRDAVAKQKAFLAAAVKHGPVNLGDSTKGGQYRPDKDASPVMHWHRDGTPNPTDVINGVDTPTTVSAVFDNYEALKAFISELREMDLGLSINIASMPADAVRCCNDCGLTRHSVEYSLGFQGRTDRLPDDVTLKLSSMCGHGMISATFAKKMIEWVRSGRRTPEDASRYMARFCVCGSYNPSRAKSLLQQATGASPSG